MTSYSKTHERDENRMMNKGISRVVLAVLFCWLPVVGLLLAIGGFLRIAVRVTQAHRVKKGFCLVLALIVLIGCMGALGYEVYTYVHDPSVLERTVNTGWKALTGQDQPPWAPEAMPDDMEDDFADYGDDAYASEDLSFDVDESVAFDESYDADFDDSEISDFNDYQKGKNARDDASAEEADDSPNQKALFDEMMANRKQRSFPRG